jgi:hypothetical protein
MLRRRPASIRPPDPRHACDDDKRISWRARHRRWVRWLRLGDLRVRARTIQSDHVGAVLHSPGCARADVASAARRAPQGFLPRRRPPPRLPRIPRWPRCLRHLRRRRHLRTRAKRSHRPPTRRTQTWRRVPALLAEAEGPKPPRGRATRCRTDTGSRRCERADGKRGKERDGSWGTFRSGIVFHDDLESTVVEGLAGWKRHLQAIDLRVARHPHPRLLEEAHRLERRTVRANHTAQAIMRWGGPVDGDARALEPGSLGRSPDRRPLLRQEAPGSGKQPGANRRSHVRQRPPQGLGHLLHSDAERRVLVVAG